MTDIESPLSATDPQHIADALAQELSDEELGSPGQVTVALLEVEEHSGVLVVPDASPPTLPPDASVSLEEAADATRTVGALGLADLPAPPAPPARGELPRQPPALPDISASLAPGEAAAEPTPARGTPAAAARRVVADRLADLGPIAKGGFGRIHLMEDRALLRRVAMKVLDERHAARDKSVRRFTEEAQITGQLDHPNIVPVHELGIDESGQRYFTMKMVQGKTLTRILRIADFADRSGRDLERVLQILLKVCDALSFAHSRGVVHRDIKPDNIMVGSHGQVYLMDWGIAHLMGQKRSRTPQVRTESGGQDAPGTILGTPAYMAPEQARGQIDAIDARTDIFSLGAILFTVLTGRPPYRGRGALEKLRLAQAGIVPDPESVAEDRDLLPGLLRITLKACAKDPVDRYQNVGELRADIEQFLRGGFWFRARHFPPGSMIIQEGAEADEAYIITKGTAEVFTTRGEAGRTVLRQLRAGDVFGETGILTSLPRTASVRAVTPMTAMVVSREALEEELAADSWFGSFVKALAARFRELDSRLAAGRARQADTTIATWLLEYMAFHGTRTDAGTVTAPWTDVRRLLMADTGQAEPELLLAIGRSGRFIVEKAHDRITLRNQSGQTVFGA